MPHGMVPGIRGATRNAAQIHFLYVLFYRNFKLSKILANHMTEFQFVGPRESVSRWDAPSEFGI